MPPSVRHLALAALALSAGACCFDVARDDACVVSRVPALPYCYTLYDDEYVCVDGDGSPPPDAGDPRGCPGVFHEGDCPHNGFTQRCYGDTYTRPGDPC
jgi:hypothetical protein